MGAANEFIRESTNPYSNDGTRGLRSTGLLSVFVLSRINLTRRLRAFADQCKAGEDGIASWAP